MLHLRLQRPLYRYFPGDNLPAILVPASTISATIRIGIVVIMT